ncbi:hypothetical protein G9P44_002197 [Scheffersomyces stipitis]|nr:hypothetical protein G9P44_002197 [Scheffersomyces stipitis]
MIDRIHSVEELEVCEEVGRGEFGVVYRELIKAEVAIKQVDLESNNTDLFEINKDIQIISECRIPQITQYFGFFVKHYKLSVIMEYMNGGSLFELLKHGPSEYESFISIIKREILLALEYLHNQGKIHLDLSTPYWMAPEVIVNNNGGHTFKADIWSLGCCGHEVFNGKPPLQNHKCFIVDPRERYSATKLLNHKLITKYANLPEKSKLLKKIITNKHF